MHGYIFKRIEQATFLPAKWDQLTNCYFQCREFLHHTELFNPCRQRYYTLWEQDQFVAGACVYTLSIQLFTFSHIPGKISMQVLGIPASISAAGIFGKSIADQEMLIQFILEQERGLLLGLNLPPELHCNKVVELTMMPTVVMEQHFDSPEAYLSSLRAPYRRRARQIQKAFEGVAEIKTGCLAFTASHYDLYKQIMRHTKDKLETLSLAFFKNLPENFQLTSYYHEDKLLCWHINCIDHNNLFFFFGGHDYGQLPHYQSYFNNLFGILKEAIHGGYQYIDFGQTAEIAKMKTGGTACHKRMFVYHRNPLIKSLLRICKPLITYRPPKAIVHPFKGTEPIHHKKNQPHENIIREATAVS